MSEKEYEQPPSISQLIGINTKLGKRNRKLQSELIELKRPMESAGFKADGMIAVGQELIRRDKQIKQLQTKLTSKDATIKNLREKAEFDMPVDMQGCFHNGSCTDPCDMIDGPCACGAWHNAKEWIGKLIKRTKQLQAKLDKANDKIDKLRKHNSECTMPRFSARGCTCGLFRKVKPRKR